MDRRSYFPQERLLSLFLRTRRDRVCGVGWRGVNRDDGFRGQRLAFCYWIARFRDIRFERRGYDRDAQRFELGRIGLDRARRLHQRLVTARFQHRQDHLDTLYNIAC